jgi:hypothetical protein
MMVMLSRGQSRSCIVKAAVPARRMVRRVDYRRTRSTAGAVPDYTMNSRPGCGPETVPDPPCDTSRLRPCRWWLRWFCLAPEQPIHHSWQCLVCRRITLD